jgi:CCR4-NOT transcriptional regulation complex NOT5 subunit
MQVLTYFGLYRFYEQTHLEESINRHKLHIIKLELILRLLDNDELSPDEVVDVKDLVEDYVERNQVCGVVLALH